MTDRIFSKKWVVEAHKNEAGIRNPYSDASTECEFFDRKFVSYCTCKMMPSEPRDYYMHEIDDYQ